MNESEAVLKSNTLGYYVSENWKYVVDDEALAALDLRTTVGEACLKVLNAADTLIDLCADVYPADIVAIMVAAIDQCEVFLHG